MLKRFFLYVTCRRLKEWWQTKQKRSKIIGVGTINLLAWSIKRTCVLTHLFVFTVNHKFTLLFDVIKIRFAFCSLRFFSRIFYSSAKTIGATNANTTNYWNSEYLQVATLLILRKTLPFFHIFKNSIGLLNGKSTLDQESLNQLSKGFSFEQTSIDKWFKKTGLEGHGNLRG